jgi:steroid 5-alpha reductase family enzyme
MPAELVLPLGMAAVVAALCWVLSLVFDEYSWVERSWSVVPQVYVGTFACQADFADARLSLMFALTTLWGARLTFNYARKGGYAKGGEDYRWRILKGRMTSWQ